MATEETFTTGWPHKGYGVAMRRTQSFALDSEIPIVEPHPYCELIELVGRHNKYGLLSSCTHCQKVRGMPASNSGVGACGSGLTRSLVEGGTFAQAPIRLAQS
jgi:hypothetical protein